jgi:hypothetical protein
MRVSSKHHHRSLFAAQENFRRGIVSSIAHPNLCFYGPTGCVNGVSGRFSVYQRFHCWKLVSVTSVHRARIPKQARSHRAPLRSRMSTGRHYWWCSLMVQRSDLRSDRDPHHENQRLSCLLLKIRASDAHPTRGPRPTTTSASSSRSSPEPRSAGSTQSECKKA